MRKYLYYLQLHLLFTIVAIILFESISITVLIMTPLLSVSCIFISEKYLLRDSYYELYYFNIFFLIHFTVVLVIEIYKATLQSIPVLLSGKAHPNVISVNCELEEPLYVAMVSNAITLTPGTVTIDVSGHRLLVLWLTPTTKESTMAGKIIKGRFEEVVRKWHS